MAIEISHGISNLDIEKISSLYGITFPNSYINFLSNYNGLFIGSNSYCSIPCLKVDDGEIEFQELYGINTSNPLFDLTKVNNIRDEMVVFKQPFIIGADSGDNFFLFSGNKNDAAIYYWDRTHIHFGDGFDYHEVNEEGNIYMIFEDFSDFYNAIISNVGGENNIIKVIF
ncbi:SMI1/KNR4 family protein [Escherichia coli]|nr:SMI1/KNR4 family protein [Escherichia coli]